MLERILVNLNYGSVKRQKKLMLSQVGVQSSKKGSISYEDCLHKEKDNAIFKNNGTHSSNTTPPLRRQSSATLLSELKSHIYNTNTELQ
jgi:hypothetical protein